MAMTHTDSNSRISGFESPNSGSGLIDPEIAISAQSLTKIYKLYESPVHRLKESINPFGKKYHKDFYALNGVSFEIGRGESVGIIGKNGSGKSTLLKILTGVLTPTSGSVVTNGKVSALLELGAGFNPELTGIENVYFSGMLMGYTRQEMNDRLDAILAFADIGDFIRQPVKTYSSGMFVRLAFAVGVYVEPDILVVDEALSVGDAYFQQKCVRKMNAFKNSGGTIIFVSHDLNSVKLLCDTSILLNNGSIVERGAPELVVNKYNSIIAEQSRSNVISTYGKGLEHGNLKAKITDVVMLNEVGTDTEVFVSGETVKIIIQVEANNMIEDLAVGFMIRDGFGQDIYGTNSYQMGKRLALASGDNICFEYKMDLNIGPGVYTLTVAAHAGKTHLEDNYHWRDAVKSFEVVFGKLAFAGIAWLETSLDIARI